MQSTDIPKDHDSEECVGEFKGTCDGKAEDVRKRSLYIEISNCQQGQVRRKQRVASASSSLNSHSKRVSIGERLSTPIGDVAGHMNATTSTHHATINAVEQQQNQVKDKIHDLLIQQSALRASSSSSSSSASVQPQHVTYERLAAIAKTHHQQQQQLLMISNLASETTHQRNNLHRKLSLDRLGRSSDTIHQFTDHPQLQRRFHLQGQGGEGQSIADLQSLVASNALSERYQQQQKWNQLTASTASIIGNQTRDAMNHRNNELLIQKLLLSRSRSNSSNVTAAATSINNNSFGPQFSSTRASFSTRNAQWSVVSGGSSTITNRAIVPTSTNASVAQLPMPSPTKVVSSTQREGQLKVGDDDDDNDDDPKDDATDRTAIAIVSRDSSVSNLLHVRNRYSSSSSSGGSMGRQVLNTAINIPSSTTSSTMYQQLQQMHHQQQMVVAQEAAIRSVQVLQSLVLVSHRNQLRTPATGQATTTTMIPNAMIATVTIPMACASDVKYLSKYQILIRRQLEYFVSQDDDVGYSVQGRKKRIVIGQVGIRCRHCSYLPHRLRGRGAGYYPSTLMGVYQAAQNMATNHLNQHCHVIPNTIREELCSLRGGRHESIVVGGGGGKQYWTDQCTDIGLSEHEDGVYFQR